MEPKKSFSNKDIENEFNENDFDYSYNSEYIIDNIGKDDEQHENEQKKMMKKVSNKQENFPPGIIEDTHVGNSKEITKEFQEMVIKYVKLDDLIRKREEEIKELKHQRKPCEKFILDYLEKINENVIEITNGKLRKNKFQTKVPLNRDIIKHVILEKIKDPKIVEEMMEMMDNLRPTKIRVNLKRTSKHKIKKDNKNEKK